MMLLKFACDSEFMAEAEATPSGNIWFLKGRQRQ